MEELAAAYRAGLTEILRRPATRRGHTNVLHHLAGFVSDALDGEDRAELAEMIERYRLGLVPLIVPKADDWTLLFGWPSWVRLNRLKNSDLN